MENLFLEILRILDYKYNNKKNNELINSDYYLIPYNYYKLLLSQKEITIESLIDIIRNTFKISSKSLFSISKIENDPNVLDNINFENPDYNFYKSRDIIFFICLYLKFLNYKDTQSDSKIDLDIKIEKIFFNNNITDNLIETFIQILKICYNNNNLLDMYNKIDTLTINNIDLDNDIFNETIKCIKKNNNYLKVAMNIHLSNNSFELGIRKSLDYDFEVVVFYIMLSILSSNLNEIKLSEIYLKIENSI